MAVFKLAPFGDDRTSYRSQGLSAVTVMVPLVPQPIRAAYRAVCIGSRAAFSLSWPVSATELN